MTDQQPCGDDSEPSSKRQSGIHAPSKNYRRTGGTLRGTTVRRLLRFVKTVLVIRPHKT